MSTAALRGVKTLSKGNNALVVFVKAPIAGKVKTRLAATIGNEAALEAYCLIAEHVVHGVRGSENSQTTAPIGIAYESYDVLLFVDSEESQLPVAGWLGGELRVQRGSDLGERLVHAFEDCFKVYERVVVIGSDAPFVSPLANDAFVALQRHDCVLGPAFDGGYYLVGLNRDTRNWRELFDDIPWSTSSVFVETVRNARAAGGIDVHLLRAMHDLDTASDMRAISLAYPDSDLGKRLTELC